MSFLGGIAGPITAELLTMLGQAVVLQPTSAGPGTYDTATGTFSTTPAAPQTGAGVVLEYSTFIRSGVRNEPGTLIREGDKQLLLSPVAVDGSSLTAPKAGDQATIGGTIYTITSVGPLAPGGEPIYYDCNLRGAA